uniref:Uncharacterized protein n=1 Tax=Megaviridae environmental sample TaxID=1737588 RepID=A0A5J6VKQ2_9VIRU|nr:MAG: hypothetical protein [Megaviridae environmental sample]
MSCDIHSHKYHTVFSNINEIDIDQSCKYITDMYNKLEASKHYNEYVFDIYQNQVRKLENICRNLQDVHLIEYNIKKAFKFLKCWTYVNHGRWIVTSIQNNQVTTGPAKHPYKDGPKQEQILIKNIWYLTDDRLYYDNGKWKTTMGRILDQSNDNSSTNIVIT